MTDKKISQLDVAATLGGTEMVELVQNGVNVRTTALAIAGLHTYKFSYSFAVDGGAVGTLVLRPAGGVLPSGFIAQTAFIDVLTILGSAGAATVAMQTPQVAEDMVAAVAYSSAPWSTTGLKQTQVFLIGSTAGRKMTADRSPTLTIAGAALNAGIFNLYVQGVMA